VGWTRKSLSASWIKKAFERDSGLESLLGLPHESHGEKRLEGELGLFLASVQTAHAAMASSLFVSNGSLTFPQATQSLP
jgi:hypothetical protein